jgi:predicted PurR-regulated permease PerM
MIIKRLYPLKRDLLWYLQVVVFGSAVLYFGRSVLVPLSFGLLLSFILYPACDWLEQKGIGRAWAILIGLGGLITIVSGLLFLLVAQFISFLSEWPAIRMKLDASLIALSELLADSLGITLAKQKQFIDSLSSQSTGNLIGVARALVGSSLSSIVLLFIIPVYAVLILYYRNYWMKVLQRIFVHERADDLRRIVGLSVQAYYRFIRGMLIVYLIVGLLNTVGLLALGVPNPILFGFIASILTIVPYVGIIVGALLPMAIAWITYDSIWYPLGVIAVFTFVQYLEANIIFPFAVSQRLKISTLATLLVIFAGGILWGLSGMILFVPFIGIAKLIADQNPRWKTLSMILGSEDRSDHEAD